MTEHRKDSAGQNADLVLRADHGPVRVLMLNRPKQRNALNLEARYALLDALRAAETEARAVVLTGSEGFFCAGGDIHSMSDDPVLASTRLDALAALAQQLVASTVPVIAAVEGGAFGAGLSLASACTYVVSSTDARFEASFGRIGLGPDTGLTWTLARRVGHTRARQIMLLMRELNADSAERIGLIDEVVDHGESLSRAIDVATKLTALPAPMVAGVNRLLANDYGSIGAATAAEAHLQLALLGTAESLALREKFTRK